MNTLARKIEKIVRKTYGLEHGSIALHEPFFNGNERQYLVDCIDTNWVSSIGKYVNLFEEAICRTTECDYAIATINGTAAMHISLLLADIKQGDEVLIPALAFISIANAITYCSASPHFVDISPVSLGVCPENLRKYLTKISEKRGDNLYNKSTDKPIKALVVTHTFGHPSQLDELKKVCEDFNITLLEDATNAIGSKYRNKHVGNHGLLSMLSFNGNKLLTTGGGGAILTNDEELAKKARHLTTVGKVSHQWKYYHDCVAYNYRLPNINAALGCAQMEQLSELISKKRLLASRYKHEFSKVEEISFFSEMPDVKSNYWLNAINLKIADIEQRNLLLDELNSIGIMAKPVWNLLNTLPMFKHCQHDDLRISQEFEASLINIPSNPAF